MNFYARTPQEAEQNMRKIYSEETLIPAQYRNRRQEYIDAAVAWAQGAAHGEEFEVVFKSGQITVFTVIKAE